MGICAAKCPSEARLDGATAIITGCNTGIGKVNALDFYKRGCRVIMACRDIAKALEAKEDILREAGLCDGTGTIIVKELNLASLASVRTFSQDILQQEPQINLLINNAGVMACPKSLTEDGFELQFGTNHLGHFLLTLLLLPRILASTPARIINLSSIAHRVGNMNLDDLRWEKTPYTPTAAYGRSKLANILFTKELAARLQGRDVTVYAVHPGVVNTDLSRHLDTIFPGAKWMWDKLGPMWMKNAEQGVQTTLHCALDEAAGSETGLYYSDCRVTTPTATARDMKLAAGLWEVSVDLVNLRHHDPFTVDHYRVSTHM